MSDPDFVQKCDIIAVFCLRDIIKFHLYGFTDDDLARFLANIAAFKELDTDKFWEGLKMDKTSEKDNSRGALSLAMAPVRDRLKMKFGEQSAIYRSLRLAEVSKASDAEFYFAAKRLHKMATLKKADIQAKGLTDAMLTVLFNAIKAFDDAIDELELAVSQRDDQTEIRINMGNSLYAEMVAMCEIGKSAWANESEAKYNDYVIYKPAPGKCILTGKATNGTTGAPVANVMVELEEYDTVVETDENGNYLMDDVEPAVVTLLADGEGYDPYRKPDLHLLADKTIVENIVLTPSEVT
jgi:hypothetical protein